jgi:cob(I)alamin adenosyltransferase
MKIYTKTGDQGTTKLVSGQTVSKFDLRLHSYGTVDELNSQIGVANTLLKMDLKHSSNKIELQTLTKNLTQIQNELFNLGSQLACDDAEISKKLPPLSNANIERLENEIDQMQLNLPELRSFILPGGSNVAAQLHVARTVCRRAERLVAELNSHLETNQDVSLYLIYLNRLSDWLFTASRLHNHSVGISDEIWQKT